MNGGGYSVTGTAGNKSATMNVDVAKYVSSVSISGSTSVEVGKTMSLTATYTKTKQSATGSSVIENRNVTNEATWSKVGSGTSYFSVTAGQITANQSNRKSGQSYLVKCEYNGVSYTIPVTFTPHKKYLLISAECTNALGGLNWTLKVIKSGQNPSVWDGSASAVPCTVSGVVKNLNSNSSITLSITPGQISNKEGSVFLSSTTTNFVVNLNPTTYWASSEDREYFFQSQINYK